MDTADDMTNPSTSADIDAGGPPIEALRDRLEISLAAAGAAGSWEWDIRNRRLYMDGRLAALQGIDEAEAARGLPTQTFFAGIHPADAPRIRIAIAGVLH